MAQDPTAKRQSADRPGGAGARMAGTRVGSAWDSALSSGEFAAIESVAFEPAGLVLGTAVFNVGYPGGWGCMGPWSSTGGTGAWSVTGGTGGRDSTGARKSADGTEVSSYVLAPFSDLVKSRYTARSLALSRAVAECRALGGDGIVGARLRTGDLPSGGKEFTLPGTAVRARSRIRPRRPFSSHLSGQDFARLPHAGWVPTALAFGISVAIRHDAWSGSGKARWNAPSQEVDDYTRLIDHARHDARVQLTRSAVSHGGDGVLVDGMELRVDHRECPVTTTSFGRIAEAVFIGTSIVRFGRHERPAGPAPLTIMRLER